VTAPSRIGRLIVFLNLVALAILVGGALLLNELRQGLVDARVDSLHTEGQLIANVMDQGATIGDPEPALEADTASDILQSLTVPRSERVRLFDSEGHQIADSYVAADRVETSTLPPPSKPGEKPFIFPGFAPRPRNAGEAQAALDQEVKRALAGEPTSGVRVSEGGGKVVSVSIPIQRVREVLGVLTLEAGDVDQIIAKERAALVPFILIALAVNVLSSFLLTQLIAQPVRRLSRAADSVRLNRARAIALPDIAERRDELGDLARSLEDMTHTLSDRMEAIERFDADVADEIRNPVSSIL
jgi:two-component system sensor histidine kinase ChvG